MDTQRAKPTIINSERNSNSTSRLLDQSKQPSEHSVPQNSTINRRGHVYPCRSWLVEIATSDDGFTNALWSQSERAAVCIFTRQRLHRNKPRRPWGLQHYSSDLARCRTADPHQSLKPSLSTAATQPQLRVPGSNQTATLITNSPHAPTWPHINIYLSQK